MRSGQQYLEALQRRRADVWIRGHRVTDLVNEPAFAGPVREIARLYDMQHDPRHAAEITHVCEETGKTVSNAFLVPRSYEDLRARRRLFDLWAEATYGLMGRTPDFLNATVTAMATTTGYLRDYDARWAENVAAYYKFVRDNDLFLTHALGDPQIDRSKPAFQQEDPFLYLGVVEERTEGLLVRGAKTLATLAPITDELIVYPLAPRQAGEERYALAFALPIDTPGLRFVCREPFGPTPRPRFDHPLASRFEEMDAVVVFHDVIIPWERVFLYGHVQAANGYFAKTGLWHQPSHQTAARGLVKLKLAVGAALRVAEAIGAEQFLHVQSALGELVEMVEIVRGLLEYAERACETTPWGEARPRGEPLLTIRGFLTHAYPRAIEVLQVIGAGGLLQSPTSDDFAEKELRVDLERYWRGRPGVGASERVHLFKLAWDLCGEAFGVRETQYERYYAGDPVRMRALHYQRYAKEELYTLVDRALAEAQ